MHSNFTHSEHSREHNEVDLKNEVGAGYYVVQIQDENGRIVCGEKTEVVRWEPSRPSLGKARKGVGKEKRKRTHPDLPFGEGKEYPPVLLRIKKQYIWDTMKRFILLDREEKMDIWKNIPGRKLELEDFKAKIKLEHSNARNYFIWFYCHELRLIVVEDRWKYSQKNK